MRKPFLVCRPHPLGVASIACFWGTLYIEFYLVFLCSRDPMRCKTHAHTSVFRTLYQCSRRFCSVQKLSNIVEFVAVIRCNCRKSERRDSLLRLPNLLTWKYGLETLQRVSIRTRKTRARQYGGHSSRITGFAIETYHSFLKADSCFWTAGNCLCKLKRWYLP